VESAVRGTGPREDGPGRTGTGTRPERAARLRELERIVDAGEQDPTEVIVEIRSIRETAEAEAGL
jgi:hypothetical protein